MRAIEASGLERDLRDVYKEFRLLLALIIISVLVMLAHSLTRDFYCWIAIPVAALLITQTVVFILSLRIIAISIFED